MAWVERPGRRVKHGRVWQDTETGEYAGTFSLAILHYPSAGPDDSSYDAAVDMRAVRVDNAQFDGWRVTAGPWHYALGKDLANHGNQDGWVGFGGRQGQHWVKFRLIRVGYLHWPTRAWEDVGGNPSYARANLSQTDRTKTLGPAGATQTAFVESVATWQRIWTTPGGGRLDISWRTDGRGLKEEIYLNQTAREWIATNRPPSTPAAETYFGFVFRLDVSDVPKWQRGGADQDLANGDFDDGEKWEVKDALGRLLAFLPLDYAFSDPRTVSGHANARTFVPLRKRLWKDPDGNHYLLVGAVVPDLNGLPVGGITFDPTFTVAETAEDGCSSDTDEFITPSDAPGFGTMYMGRGVYGASDNCDFGGIWRGTGIVQGSTINTATTVLTDDLDSSLTQITGAWWGFKPSPYSITDFSNADAHRVSDHHARTTASVADNFVGGTVTTHTSPSLVTVLQEIVDTADFDGDVGLTWRNSGTTNGRWYAWTDYSESPSGAADLNVTWTEPPPAAVAVPMPLKLFGEFGVVKGHLPLKVVA